MNRKELANALTDLDDRFIAEARQPVPDWRRYWPLGTAAAVLALIFLWTSWSRPSVIARYQGEIITASLDIGDLGDLSKPVRIGPRSRSGVTLPIHLELDGPWRIQVEGGFLTLTDKSGSVFLEEGGTLEIRDQVELYWTIDPSESGPRRLTLEASGTRHEITLSMTAEGTWQLWHRP